MLKAVAILSHIIAGMMIFTVIWILWVMLAREAYAQWEGSAVSPDGGLEAQVLEFGTYASRHEVYLRNKNSLLPLSKKIADLNEAKLNQCAAGVNIVWRTSSDLEIQYLNAGWSEVPEERVRVGGRWITVKLKPYSADASARCGSMKSRS